MWEEITPVELAAWQALSGIEPWGEDRQDLRFKHLFGALILWNNPAADVKDVMDSLDYMPKTKAKPAATAPPADEMAETKAAVEAAMRQIGGAP